MLTSSTFQRLRDYLRTNVSALAFSNVAPAAPLPTGLSHWRSMVASAKAGTAGGKFLLIGDSTTLGVGSANRQQCYPYTLYQTLLAAGVPVTWDACCGSTPQYSSGELGVTITGGQNGGFPSLTYGYVLGSGGVLSFLPPTSQCDTFDVYYLIFSQGGTASVDINGTVVGTMTTSSGGVSVQKQTFTAPKGNNTINITQTGGNYVQILLIDAYDSSAHKIRIIPGGIAGDTAVQIGNAYDATGYLAQLAPKLVSYDIGINDWSAGEDLSTYSSAIENLVKPVQAAGGDIYLIGPNATGASGGPSEATQKTYTAAMQTLATNDGFAFQDIRAISATYATYAAAAAAGKMSSDAVHPSIAGYADIGPYLAQPLLVGV